MTVLRALLGDSARQRLVEWALEHEMARSESELARALGLTPRSVRNELCLMEDQGLVRRERVGREDRVLVVREHPAWEALGQLAHLEPRTLRQAGDERTRRELVAAGAPLTGTGEPVVSPRPLEALLVDAVDLARRDATVLRVLPTFVAMHERRLRWETLVVLARRARRSAELGVVVALAAEACDRPQLARWAELLKDGRRKGVRSFHAHELSSFELRLAQARTPKAAQEWGFLMNMDLDAFRTTWRRHAEA